MRTKKEFNWFTELDKAIENRPSKYMRQKMTKLAAGWVSCACGQLCKDLPRFDYGGPKDVLLFNLGANFYQEIGDRQYISALQVLRQIEKRTSQLLINPYA